MSVDKKALRILFDAHWSSRGWKFQFDCSDADFEYAKHAGLMFDAVSLTHKKLVSEIRQYPKHISKNTVRNAFLASLSTRRLDLRSALSSYALALNLPAHDMTKSSSNNTESGREWCQVCDADFLEGTDVADLNVLNFERFKWGGVRRLTPTYIWFDLREFATTEPPLPVAEDHKIFAAILEIASEMNDEATVSDLEKSIAGLLPSNKDERRVLIEILSTCGILLPRGRSGFWKSFDIPRLREHTGQHKNDWSYPAIWWRGSDGINRDALRYYFDLH